MDEDTLRILADGLPAQAVLDHGCVVVRNIASHTMRMRMGGRVFDADDVDPAKAARMSFARTLGEDRKREEDIALDAYLMRNRHTTPFEMVEIWLEMKMPIFVARQFVRHRTVSINEVSARYVQLPNEFYIPKPEHVGHRGKNMKQGRIIDGTTTHEALAFVAMLEDRCEASYREYEYALNNGIPPEVARMVLHLNHYTHWLWKQDLHNIMHFLMLRVDGHAQFEAREYGNAIVNLLEPHLPECFELFRKYRMMTPQEAK